MRFSARAAIYSSCIIIVSTMVVTALINSVAYIRFWADDNSYHIPMAVEIYRHGNPYYVDPASAFTAYWFPASIESLVAIFISIRQDIAVTNLTGAIFYIVFLIVTYKFADLWNSDGYVKLLCVSLASIVPILIAQTKAFYVDIPFNLTLFISIYCYCSSIIRKDKSAPYFGMAAVILSASIKYHGIVACAVLLPIGCYCAFKTQYSSTPLKKVALVLLLICSVFTSGWYVRNWMEKGNPVYPLALPSLLHPLLEISGTSYEGIDFPNLSPRTAWPHPWIPKTIAYYRFEPHMTDDAFGIMFPISLTMMGIVLLQIRRFPDPERHAIILVSVSTLLLLIALPISTSVPRYVIFFPVILSLWPAMILHPTIITSRSCFLASSIVVVVGFTYIAFNLLDTSRGTSILADGLDIISTGRRTDILQFDFVEEGNLRIGYMGGRYTYTATLYDLSLTNELVEIHYQDYSVYTGRQFDDPDAFIEYIENLDLDYICIFDEHVPGANIILDNFPDIAFVEDTIP